jgi:hypothetical protein
MRSWGALLDLKRVGDLVMMPGKDGSGAAIRLPALGKLANPPLAGFFGQPKNAADLDLDCKIAGGPDIGAALGKEQIDLGRPPS